MAKFYGKIGYVELQELAPDSWREVRTERAYYGDVIKNTRRWEKGEHQNSNLNVNNQISIVADAYALHNFFSLRYIWWMGTTWQVTNVLVEHPRLLLTIGGVYNGDTGPTG